MQINACDAETFESVSMNNPDFERSENVQIDDGRHCKKWSMSRNESWGNQRLTVYRSTFYKQMLWFYPRYKIWALLHAYDEDREDDDMMYANYIYQLMSQPSSVYDLRNKSLGESNNSSENVATVTENTVASKNVADDAHLADGVSGSALKPQPVPTSNDDKQDYSFWCGAGPNAKIRYEEALKIKNSCGKMQSTTTAKPSDEDLFGDDDDDMQMAMDSIVNTDPGVHTGAVESPTKDTAEVNAVKHRRISVEERIAIVEEKHGKGVLDGTVENAKPAATDDATKATSNDSEDDLLSTRVKSIVNTRSDVKQSTKDVAFTDIDSESDSPLSKRFNKEAHATNQNPDSNSANKEFCEDLTEVKLEVKNASSASTQQTDAAIQDLEKMKAELEKYKKQHALAESENVKLRQEASVFYDREQSLLEGKQNAERLHENYKKREFRKIKQATQQAASLTAELSRIKGENESFDQERQRMQDEIDRERAKKSKTDTALLPCIEAYKELIKHCHISLQSQIEHVMKNGSNTSSSTSKYTIFDGGTWINISAPIEAEIDKLKSKTDCVTYSIGSNNYETRLHQDTNDKFVYAIQKNTNPQFLTQRLIRKTYAAITKASDKTCLSEDHKKDLLFGKSFIKLCPTMIDSMLLRFNFDGNHSSSYSLALAQLAELFNTLSMNFKYTQGNSHRSCVFVKPLALQNFLKIAKSRKYTFMRIGLHAGSTEAFDGVEKDPLGMNMFYANKNGQAYGGGFYFGLSCHVTKNYCYPAVYGTAGQSALMALLLTNENIDHNKEMNGSYKTFNLAYTDRFTHNCIVYHETSLILILGKVVIV